MKIFRGQFDCGICAYAKHSKNLINAKCPKHGKEDNNVVEINVKKRINLRKAENLVNRVIFL